MMIQQVWRYTNPNTYSTRHVACTSKMTVWYHILVLICFVGTMRVTIRGSAGPLTAEQSYNLTCTVVLNGTTGSPTIKWLYPNNNPLLNSSSVTVDNMVIVNDTAYERTLLFSSLRTSHGGQYTCRAVLGQTSAMASTKILLQGAYVKSIVLCIYFVNCVTTVHYSIC